MKHKRSCERYDAEQKELWSEDEIPPLSDKPAGEKATDNPPRFDWSTILPRFDSPHNDNERLLNLQFCFKVQNDRDALGKMYELLCVISRKQITLFAKKNYKVKCLSDEEKEQKAHDSASEVIERFLRREDFWVRKSFISEIYFATIHTLYYEKTIQKRIIYVEELTNC